jgi:hypothetical protein
MLMPAMAKPVLVSQRKSTCPPRKAWVALAMSGAAPMETTVAVATPHSWTAGKYSAE